MCSFVTQHNATEVLRESEIGLLTARMSTRAVARECNVYLSTIVSSNVILENLVVHPTSLTTADHV
jgi:hypothetical protein